MLLVPTFLQEPKNKHHRVLFLVCISEILSTMLFLFFKNFYLAITGHLSTVLTMHKKWASKQFSPMNTKVYLKIIEWLTYILTYKHWYMTYNTVGRYLHTPITKWPYLVKIYQMVLITNKNQITKVTKFEFYYCS